MLNKPKAPQAKALAKMRIIKPALLAAIVILSLLRVNIALAIDIPSGGGEKVFRNCISRDHASAEYMWPTCPPTTDEALSADLDSLKDAQCHAFGYDRYGPCTWIGPMRCSLNILSSWSGCEREYAYEAWDCHNSNCHRPARNFTDSLAQAGITWVDYAHLQCPPEMLFYRTLFDDTSRSDTHKCLASVDDYVYYPHCPAGGNPIHLLTGVKRQVEALPGARVGGLGLELVYDSFRHVPLNDDADPLLSGFQGTNIPGFGADWSSSLHRHLTLQKSQSSSVLGALLHRGSSKWISFKKLNDGSFAPNYSANANLSVINSQYLLKDFQALTEESYNTAGVLQAISMVTGGRLDYTYSTAVVDGVSPRAGLLISVSDAFGRKLEFYYEAAPNGASRVYKIDSSGVTVARVGYDASGNLSRLTWSDERAKAFAYERPEFSQLLTGILDEEGKRFATFGYDGAGRANHTEHAGGVQAFSVSWATPATALITQAYDTAVGVVRRRHEWVVPVGTSVTEPLGSSATLDATLVNGMPRQTGRSQPGGSGCNASSSSLGYDSSGNVIDEVDFVGQRTCRAYMAGRNVEAYRIEGLSKADSCPPDLAAYQVPAGQLQRKVSTQWHPLWKLEARRAEPKRITTTVYNGLVDPVDSNHPTLTCASGAPALPDGSLIAVVCRRYEQSTDDDTGNLGFTAPVKETRVWNYTYNQYGQALTETDPRGKPTTYEYWSDTAFTGERGHWMGDLKKVTNALNQSTNHLEYNKRGQVLTTELPNGSTEQREYHVRGWLTKVTLVPAGGGVGQVTQYDYFDTGLLKKVTQPDGSFALYEWDAAHRLTDVTDSGGNKVHYELDNAGNRTKEEFKDPQGELAKTISRTFDALGRMSSVSGLQ